MTNNPHKVWYKSDGSYIAPVSWVARCVCGAGGSKFVTEQQASEWLKTHCLVAHEEDNS